MVQALGLASFAPSGRSDLKRIFTGAPDSKLRRPDDLRLPTSGSQDAWGQWEGPCPACDEGTDRFRIHLDGTIWCRVCAPDGDPVAFANLFEATGLPMQGARGGAPKPALVIVEASELAGLCRGAQGVPQPISWRRNRCLPNDPTGLRRFAPVPPTTGATCSLTLNPSIPNYGPRHSQWWRQGGQSAALPRTLILDRGRSGRTETRSRGTRGTRDFCLPPFSPDRRTP